MKVANVMAQITNMMCAGEITEAMVEDYIAKNGNMSEEQVAAAIAAHPECADERALVNMLFA